MGGREDDGATTTRDPETTAKGMAMLGAGGRGLRCQVHYIFCSVL